MLERDQQSGVFACCPLEFFGPRVGKDVVSGVVDQRVQIGALGRDRIYVFRGGNVEFHGYYARIGALPGIVRCKGAHCGVYLRCPLG